MLCRQGCSFQRSGLPSSTTAYLPSPHPLESQQIRQPISSLSSPFSSVNCFFLKVPGCRPYKSREQRTITTPPLFYRLTALINSTSLHNPSPLFKTIFDNSLLLALKCQESHLQSNRLPALFDISAQVLMPHIHLSSSTLHPATYPTRSAH